MTGPDSRQQIQAGPLALVQPATNGITVSTPAQSVSRRGLWMALLAALLGWMFDGFEMGLFPVVSRPAIQEMLTLQGMAINDDAVSFWNSLINSSFLIGAATGGVVFGWLGDRLGRVRAMTLSIL